MENPKSNRNSEGNKMRDRIEETCKGKEQRIQAIQDLQRNMPDHRKEALINILIGAAKSDLILLEHLEQAAADYRAIYKDA